MERKRPSVGRLTHGAWQVEGLRETLLDVSDEDEASPTAFETESSDSPGTRSTRILSGDVQTRGLRASHPSSAQILMLCTYYIENFDPMFKVLHLPTLRKSVLEASADIDNIAGDRSLETLMFAMYCAAVTTLTPEKCLEVFHEEKESLLMKYRHGAEIAFSNADLFTSADLVMLQALVIFLVSSWKIPHAQLIRYRMARIIRSPLARCLAKPCRRSRFAATMTPNSSGR